MIERNKILTVKDVADHLHISVKKAYQLIRLKGFPKIIIGHRYFIPEEQYYKWIEENTKHTVLL